MITKVFLKLLLLTAYAKTIVLMLSIGSMLGLWVVLETNMVIFACMIICFSKTDVVSSYHQAYNYLVVQALGSSLILAGMILEIVSMTQMSYTFLFLGIFTKMGVFPFYSWMFYISENMGVVPLVAMLTVQKIPLIMFLNAMQYHHVFFSMIMTMILGSLLTLKSHSMRELLVASSIYFTFWLWVIAQFSMTVFLLSFLIYTVFTLVGLMLDKAYKKGRVHIIKKILWIMVMMFLIGLPPMGMVYFKAYVMAVVLIEPDTLFYTLMFVSTVASAIGYIKNFLAICNLPTFNLFTKEVENGMALMFFLSQVIFVIYNLM